NQLEDYEVLNESLRSRSNSWGLHMPLVTELSPEETESVTGGYGKAISHVIIELKIVKRNKAVEAGPKYL
ncbi:hypothetical protein Tco_1270529, partial [Tanacetum coccineum]